MRGFLKIIVSKIGVIFLLTACGGGADSQQSFKEKPSCELVSSADCACAQNTFLMESQGGKSCIDIESSNFCLENKNGFMQALEQKDQKLFKSCFVFKSQKESLIGFLNPQLAIHTGDMTPSEKKELAVWADKNQDLLKNLELWSSASDVNSTAELYYVGFKRLAEHTSEIFNPIVIPYFKVSYIQVALAPKFFESVSALIQFLETPDKRPNVDESQFAFDSRAEILVHFYNSNILKPLEIEDSVSVQGCSVSCSRSALFKNIQGYNIKHREYVVEGVVYRTEMILYDQHGNNVATIYLAKQHLLLLTLIDRDDLGVVLRTSSFDPNGKKQHILNHTPMTGLDYLREREEFVGKGTSFDFSVGVCETQFSPKSFKLAHKDKNLHFGPYLDSSYFGWIKKPIDARNFWQARILFNNLGLEDSFNSSFFDEHALDVTQVLVDDPEFKIGVIPFGITECFESQYIKTILPEAQSNAQLRVMNLSISDFIEKDYCKIKYADHPLLTSQETLWVLAAGNQAHNGALSCPQHLSGAKNIIIVAAANDGVLDHGSNFGDDYADIATSGKGYEGIGWGTSFAAPKVSRVAAKILFLYPELTAEQARMAILLGARTVNKNFQVRSRGVLDEARALMYSEALHRGDTPETAILKIECNGKSSCEDQVFKLSVLAKVR